MTTQLDETTTAYSSDETTAGPCAQRSPAADASRAWWRRVHWGAVLAVIVAAALRLWWLGYAGPAPVSDFAGYLRTAGSLVDSGFVGLDAPSAWRLPAFPAYLALGLTVSRDGTSLSLWTTALSVAQVALTYWLALLVFRRRSAAFAAAMVAAIAPAFVMFAPVLASEHLLAVLLLATLVAAMKTPRTRWLPTATVTGLLLGAAVLTRGEALAYLPAIALIVAVGVWKGSGTPHQAAARRRRVARTLGAVAVVAAATMLVVAPWVVRNERVVGSGAGLSTTGGFNFYLAHSPGEYGWRRPLPLPLQVRDEVTRNDLGWYYGLRYVRDHPDEWLPTIAEGTRELLAPAEYAAFYATVFDDGVHTTLQPRDDVALRDDAIALAGRSSAWLLWAALGGLLLVPVWRTRAWLAVVGIAVANWTVYAVIFWAQARYRFVVDALACVAAGAVPAALAAVASRTRRGRSR